MKKNEPWIWEGQQQKDFGKIKQMLTEGPCLAHYAKEEENIVTTDVSTPGLGITLRQKQDDRNHKTNSIRKQVFKRNGKEKLGR